MTLHGLRVCPDLDTVMYTLGGGIHEGQGWGREGETFGVAAELAAYGRSRSWFTLGDRDIATHLVRTRLLGQGLPLSQVTARLCERWQPGVRLLPMSDDRIETHVVIDDPNSTVVIDDPNSTVVIDDPNSTVVIDDPNSVEPDRTGATGAGGALPGVVGAAACGRAGPADPGRRHGVGDRWPPASSRRSGRRPRDPAAEQPGGLDRHHPRRARVRQALRDTAAAGRRDLADRRRRPGTRAWPTPA